MQPHARTVKTLSVIALGCIFCGCLWNRVGDESLTSELTDTATMRHLLTLLLVILLQDGMGTAPSTLKKLIVVFRHGFRSMDHPYFGKFEDCFPDSKPGDLSRLGRSQMSFLGYYLRMRYNTFIGRDPKKTLMVYSDYPRNIVSAKLVFDGLFSEYNHSGIAFKMVEPDVDGPLETNDTFFQESFEAMMNTTLYVNLIKNLSRINKTKYPIKSVRDLYHVDDNIKCQLGNGCTVPDWIESPLQSQVAGFTNDYFNSYRMCRNEKIVRQNSDLMVQQINKELDPKNTGSTYKAFLYSSHDTNIAALLSRLGIFDGLTVPFGAFVVLEGHSGGSGQEDVVQILYQKYTDYVYPPKSLVNPAGLSYSEFVKMGTKDFPCLTK